MHEHFYKKVLERSPMGYAYHKIVCDAHGIPIDYEFLEVNQSFEVLTGLVGKDILGKRVTSVLPEIKESAFDWIAYYGEVALNLEERSFKHYSEPLKKWYSVNVYSIEKGFFITNFIETTEIEEARIKLSQKEEILKNFFDVSLDLFCVTNKQGEIVAINGLWSDVLGYSMDELLEKKLLGFIYPDDLCKTEKAFMEVVSGNKLSNFINRYQTKTGDLKYIEWQAIMRGDLLYASASDITEKILSENERIISQIRYEQLAEISRAIAFEVNRQGIFTFVSDVSKTVLGYTPDELIGKKSIYDISYYEDQEPLTLFCEDHCQHLNDHEHRLVHKNGDVVWMMLNGLAVKNEHEKFELFRGMGIDITHLKEVEEKITYLSFHDDLTGLYNRRFFEEELLRLDVERNLPLAVLMIDANGLKLINDAFGHETGDLLLKKIADVLKSACRADDIIARVGGDEFIVLLPKTYEAEVSKISDRVMKLISVEEIKDIPISIAYGWEIKKVISESVLDVIKIAETHMYKKKNNGRIEHRNQAILKILHNFYRHYPHEKAHSDRVSQIAQQIGFALNLELIEIENLKLSGIYHDIGKVAISEEVLRKIDPLDVYELYELKRHPEVSYVILNSSNDFSRISEEILHHHEWYNGMGYPKKLMGEEIPLNSRILSVAEAFDDMTRERHYKKVMTEKEAADELLRNAGKQFDPMVVDTFVHKILRINGEEA